MDKISKLTEDQLEDLMLAVSQIPHLFESLFCNYQYEAKQLLVQGRFEELLNFVQKFDKKQEIKQNFQRKAA